MADEIIYNIKVEGAESATQQLGLLQAELKKINTERNALIKKQSEGNALTEQEKTKLSLLTQKQSELNEQKKQATQIVNTQARANQTLTSAYQQLQIQLTQNRNKYRDLAAAGKANTEEGKKMLATITAHDKKLKDIDASMGQHQRNVGNYKNDIISAFQQMGIPIGGVTTLLNAQATAQRGLAAATANGSSAMKIFRLALISTGIGAIVVAIGALAAGFLSTQRGVDAVNKVLIPLRVVMQRVWGIVQELGTAMVDAFSNPKQAISDLWQALKTNIINRFTGIADQFRALGKIISAAFSLDFEGMKQGAAELGESTIQVLTGVDNLTGKVAAGFNSLADEIGTAVDEGKSLSEIKIQLEELAIKQAEQEGKLKRIFEEQRTILMDVNASDSERLKAGNEAIKAAEDQRNLKLEELNLLIEQQAIKNKQNDTDREAQAEYARLVSQREELEANFLKETMRVRNQMNTLTKQAAQEVIDGLNNIAKTQKKVIEDFIKETQAAIDEEDIIIEPEIVFDEQRVTENLTNFVGAFNAAQKQISKFSQVSRGEQIEAEIEAVTEMFNNKLITAEQYNKAITELVRERTDLHISYLQNLVGGVSNLMDTLSDVFEKGTVASKAFAIASRTLASANAVVSTYQAANKALASAPPPWNFIQMAAVIAAGLANVIKINSVKFAKGGIIGGNLHGSGGTQFYGSDGSRFEAERGELLTIVNRHDTERLSALSAINSKHGRAFYASGGIHVPGAIATGGIDRAMLREIVNETVRGIGAIPVVVSENDITTAQKSARIVKTKGDY